MKKTKVISIAIHKGGVGKTTVTSNLGYALAELGNKVLLIDSDSQENLTYSFGLENENEKNFYEAFINEESIKKHILETNHKNIDMVISDVKLSKIEIAMANMDLREFRVRSILKEVVEEGIYDYILIDTNPSLGMFNTAIFYAVDYNIIPIQYTPFGIKGLQIFVDHFENIREKRISFDKDDKLEILGVLGNAVDNRIGTNDLSREVINDVFGEKVFKTEIPSDNNITNAQWHEKTLIEYAKDNSSKRRRAYNMFLELAKEVEERVKE